MLLKSRNKFLCIPSSEGKKGWVYKKTIYFLIINNFDKKI